MTVFIFNDRVKVCLDGISIAHFSIREFHAWTNIVESASQIDIARANLEVARENLSLNTFSYNEGLLTILDVISAQLSWLQAYTNTITANFNQKVAIAAYHKAIADTGIQQEYGTTSAVP